MHRIDHCTWCGGCVAEHMLLHTRFCAIYLIWTECCRPQYSEPFILTARFDQRARLTWYLATFNTKPQSIKSQFKSNSIVIFRYITELHECSSECHRLYSKQIDVHLIVSSVYSARLLSNRLRRPRSHNLISLENVCCINELWQCNGALRFHWGWKYVHCTM